jgi:hypothetical protein
VRSVAGATCSRRVIPEQVITYLGCNRYPAGVSISPRIRAARRLSTPSICLKDCALASIAKEPHPPLFLVAVLYESALGPPFVHRCRTKEGGTLGTAALCRPVRASRLGTDREHTGNRLVTLPSGNAIPTAIRAARGSAPNLKRAGSVPPGSCPSESRVPAASGGTFPIPR